MTVKLYSKTGSLAEILRRVKSSGLFWVISFSILTVLSAQVAVPVQPVPFTLQTMLVLLSGAFLGARNGMYSQIAYLGAGLVGMPVFAGFSFGPQVLFGPTGGYLLAFPLAAFLVGYVVRKDNSFLTVAFSMLLGAIVILFTGTLYLSLFFGGNFSEALYSGALIFSIWDLIKIASAISIYTVASKKFPKLPA